MQTIDEVREHCRFVGKGIEKTVRMVKTSPQSLMPSTLKPAPPLWSSSTRFITHERLSGKTGLTGFRQIVPFTNREM